MNKYEKILNDTWEYLDSNYKGSEIRFDLWLDLIIASCDNDYCLKKCIKLLWTQWEWFNLEERKFYIRYIKDNFSLIVR